MRESDDIGAAISAAAATVGAPVGLRERLVAQQAARGRRRRVGGLLAAAGALVAAVIVVLVLTLLSGGPAPVEQAADLALAPPTRPAPAPIAGTGRLDAAVGDVAFPDWGRRHGWHPVGRRDGEVAGRAATTVVYEDAGGRRVGYTIVDAPPLAAPGGDRQAVAGTDVTLWRYDDAAVATWEVRGQTCILAARDVPADDLARLASWGGVA